MTGETTILSGNCRKNIHRYCDSILICECHCHDELRKQIAEEVMER